MTNSVGPREPIPVDWVKIGQNIQEAQVHFAHHAEVPLHGDDFYAAVARRALGCRKLDRLTYETVNGMLGLITSAESAWLVEGHTAVSRLNAESAAAQVVEMRAEVRRVQRDAARDLVEYLRGWCNERRIPAKTRREGFLMAADQIDPDITRDHYGDVVRS
jgi:hypothetical protein